MAPGPVNPTMRPGTVDDIPAILRFWTRAAEDAHRPTDSAVALVALIERDPDALVVAVDGDEVVGSLIAGWDGWRFHLYRLAVHPEYRRRGIADRLLEDAERRMIDAGVDGADAMVLDDNDDAHRFWAARGYQRQAEWSRWVKPLHEDSAG